MKTSQILLLLALAFCSSCSGDNTETVAETLEAKYAASIADAARELTEDDIYDGLLPIVYGGSELLEWRIEGGDTMVLVSSLQEADWYYASVEEGESFESSEQTDYVIWVAVPSQVRSYFEDGVDLADSTAVNLRFLQVLGLKPDDNSSTVYEFWANKNDLLRPSYVNDITTNAGAIEYAENTEPEWFEGWLDDNIAYSYESPAEGLNYPFTRLGYTYDWGGESKFGPSEYIVKPSSKLIMHSKTGCLSYVR